MPTAGQLRQLAQAAAQNAADLAADARLLLDAGRFPRAHALATLALEELGKPELCRAVLAGKLDDKGFRQEWSNHLWKLDRSRILAILSAPTAARVFATADDDCATKLRGLYVDVNPSDPSGPPRTPSEVTLARAREMVETAEEATRLERGRAAPCCATLIEDDGAELGSLMRPSVAESHPPLSVS